MIDFNLSLQHNNIRLRPLHPNDFEAFEKLTGDAAMWTYFTSDLSVTAALQAWVNDALGAIKGQSRLAFTIMDDTAHTPIGSTSFGNISMPDKRLEIGWTWICKACQGKGINAQVKMMMLRYCFETLDFERVEFKTDVLHIAARKALLSIGATEEGVLRSHTQMTHNRRRDTIYYSILKSEWELVKQKYLSNY